jgi:hypothetical protein
LVAPVLVVALSVVLAVVEAQQSDLLVEEVQV